MTGNQLTSRSKTRLPRIRRGSRAHGLRRCPHKKGVCSKVTTMKPKKPNSAIRKIAKVKLSTKRRVTCYIPGQGHDLREYSHVLVRGGYVPDLPGVQYHLVKGKFDFSWKEREVRKNSRSKYGIPRNPTDY